MFRTVSNYKMLMDFDEPRTYYDILGINSDSSQREIKATYVRLARQFHPDFTNDMTDPRMIEINHIYEVLSNPEKKKEYDAAHVPGPAYDFRRPYDFTKPHQAKGATAQKSSYPSVKKPQYLKILRVGLTVVLICCAVYLTFYLAVNMIHFITALPDWLLKLAPVSSS